MTTLTDPAQTFGPSVTGRARRRLVVTGVVQGVGFRPFVYVSAAELGITGWVTNDSVGVIIDAEGRVEDIDALVNRLSTDHPPLARVDGVASTQLPLKGATSFAIIESSRSGNGRTLAPPDVATCDACLTELADPHDHRYRHPFISCTNCGPRFTIIFDLPYDRPTTTMAGFAMCAWCTSEYHDPANRRFHAQTVACPDCGPHLRLVRPGQSDGAGHVGDKDGDEQALAQARRMLSEGAVLAVKGTGGYHLMCDATNEAAVSTLRRRKRRGSKPFAVMVRDVDAARRYAIIDEREASLLISPARPIVLVRRMSPGASAAPSVAPSVAPGVPDLGLLVAYTPVHSLLLGLAGEAETVPALVATSGNLSGETIVADDEEALSRLAPLVDGWLVHDRPIHVPCDDSVMRVVAGAPLPLRRARGYAPLPVPLPVDVEPTLATGADLKNTCCLASGRQAWVSQHIGDMDDMATLGAFTRTEAMMEALTGVVPVRLVADAHPGYRSTGWARRHANGRPLTSVQHHHAHVASLMGEHEVTPGTKVIGFAFDGTGLGTDGAVWGGEVLVADYASFTRFAHLGYVPLAGGDASVQRPYRMALAHLTAAGVAWDPDLACVAACPAPEAVLLDRQLATGAGCVPTSSMGRLFDAVASLCGVRHIVDYEAQAAMQLEGLARDAPQQSWAAAGYVFGLDPSGLDPSGRPGPVKVSAAPVVRQIVQDVRSGAGASDIAVRLHSGVVMLVVELARRARTSTGLDVVGLTGGVFQNALLLSGCARELSAEGFTVLRHRFLPPNDGGLALGQVLVSSYGQQQGGPICA